MGCESIFYIKVKKDNNWAFLPLIKENDFGDKELAHFYFCGWEILDIIKDYAQPTFLTDEDYEATGYEKDEDFNALSSYEMSYALIKYLAAKEYSEEKDPEEDVKRFWTEVDTMIAAGLDFAGYGWKHIDDVKILIIANF